MLPVHCLDRVSEHEAFKDRIAFLGPLFSFGFPGPAECAERLNNQTTNKIDNRKDNANEKREMKKKKQEKQNNITVV